MDLEHAAPLSLKRPIKSESLENMTQYSFKNDYSEGAHARIIKALGDTNMIQEQGYGVDRFCNQAIHLIRNKIQNQNADIHFVSGGTQANLIVISSILRSFESVIAANTGHIVVHEAGAIESTGHKINVVETTDGKLCVQDIRSVLASHTDEHMVRPKMVFISNSTELGGIYSKKELDDLYNFCRKNNLYLYLDGARLGAALTSANNDLTIAELARRVDAFYIGGTKNGALLGEAIVIIHGQLKNHFRFQLKQKGALLAKGRIFGVQFLELFKEDLYFDLARHANAMAARLADGIQNQGYGFLAHPATNQIFPVFPNILIERLRTKYGFYVWQKIDDAHSAIRLVTSWATKKIAVDSFLQDLRFFR